MWTCVTQRSVLELALQRSLACSRRSN